MKITSISRVVGVGLAVAIFSFTTFGAVVVGCGGPYKGPPDKLPKVKKVKNTEVDAGPAEDVIVYDEACKVNFGDDPMKAKKSASKANPIRLEGDDALSNAEASSDPQTKISLILGAIDKYKKALLEDNYNADATFGLAVAYAQVRKKGCAIKMLKRLAELETNDRLAGGSGKLDNVLKKVEDEPAFSGFITEAMGAIGR